MALGRALGTYRVPRLGVLTGSRGVWEVRVCYITGDLGPRSIWDTFATHKSFKVIGSTL